MFKRLLVTEEELLKGFLACSFMETVVTVHSLVTSPISQPGDTKHHRFIFRTIARFHLCIIHRGFVVVVVFFFLPPD